MALGPRSASRAQDGGSTHVLEAVLLSLILLGAAYSVSTLTGGGAEEVRPRTNLQALTNDALVVLEGLEDERGPVLGNLLAEGFRCASAVASEDDCDGTRSENLSFKLQSYLPAGAGYAYGLGNGMDVRMLYRAYSPAGETVTASLAFVPDWNLTYVSPELSCYELGMDVNLTAIPIWHGGLAKPTFLNATVGGSSTSGVKEAAGAWNLSLPAATRPAAATVVANAAARNMTLPGATAYGACDLGGRGPGILLAARAVPFLVVTPNASVGGEARFLWEGATLAAIPTVTVVSANVTIYEPLPPRGTLPDTFVPQAVVPLAGTSGEVVWKVPASSLYGIHPVRLTIRLDVAGTTVEAYRVGTLGIALPTGEVPIDPPYRAVLQTWFPDWR